MERNLDKFCRLFCTDTIDASLYVNLVAYEAFLNGGEDAAKKTFQHYRLEPVAVADGGSPATNPFR